MGVSIPYARQLLDQAHELASKDSRKPTQASLRRAVSTAYYALFHLLVEDACATIVGGQRKDGPLRGYLARVFVHRSMLEACKQFSGKAPPPELLACVPRGVISNELRLLSETFVDLQQRRHEADYDLMRTFLKQEVRALLDQTTLAFACRNVLKRHPEEYRVFLIALLGLRSRAAAPRS